MTIDIDNAVFRYIEALHYPDDTRRSSAFHDGARVAGQEDGVLIDANSEEFMAYCRKMRLPRRKMGQSYKITWKDVTGNVACVRLEEDLPERRHVSFLTLMRISGAWKVMFRGFYAAAIVLVALLPSRATVAGWLQSVHGLPF